MKLSCVSPTGDDCKIGEKEVDGSKRERDGQWCPWCLFQSISHLPLAGAWIRASAGGFEIEAAAREP